MDLAKEQAKKCFAAGAAESRSAVRRHSRSQPGSRRWSSFLWVPAAGFTRWLKFKGRTGTRRQFFYDFERREFLDEFERHKTVGSERVFF